VGEDRGVPLPNHNLCRKHFVTVKRQLVTYGLPRNEPANVQQSKQMSEAEAFAGACDRPKTVGLPA